MSRLSWRYILLRAFLAITAVVPLRLLHALGRAWAALLMGLPNRMRATTATNLRLCFPQASAAERQRLCRQSLCHTVCLSLEMGKCWLWPIARTCALVRETRGLEALNAAIAGDRGVIVLAPHLGNWELFGFYITAATSATFLYQPPRHRQLDALLRRVRSRSGVRMAPASRRGVATVLRSLAAGELVGILPDQVPEDEGGMYAPFFGQPALTMTLIGRLAADRDVQVFIGFAERLPRSQGFRVIVEPADPALGSPVLAESVAGLNRSVERMVRRALAQYQWEYKRFKRQPDGRQPYP